MAEKLSINDREKATQKLWEDQKVFEASLEQTKNGPRYSFYDGPPFATGTPHYGHLVASVMKDVVPRYWTMKGHFVERRWGWDCHGLPIENIVEKELDLKSKKDIEEIGVAKFNELCRSRVLTYVEEWKKTMKRFGRWADMENAYKTMDQDYMESVWWTFKQLWDKGLVYEGYKSMHVCPRCETTLSQQEVSEGYRDIKDLSATAKFELVGESGTFILAWTTTPWTLPANVALAVGEEIEYVKIKKDDEYFILAKARLEIIKGDYTVIEELTADKLVGRKYHPLFSYYLNETTPNRENLYTVVSANFVTTSDGTGVVHIAPAFGEEDMLLGKEKNLPFIQNVTMSGHFTAEVVDFPGANVKPAEDTQQTDVAVIKYLAGKNLLFTKEKYEHSYPHCWRCDTPLINYATSSWFVKVTSVKEKALELAQEINWSPEHIKEGRFGHWLAGARDWSISRQRFWASCMPIWKCSCGELKVYGAIADLEKDSGEKITDLHKHKIDHVAVTCPKCSGIMKRIPDVLDCWFESGSMPFAQEHYPFENQEKFAKKFPAQFIAEGIDQTRAWFYYLHVISTAINNKVAFKNVIVNGTVLAEDGKKMSKRLKNYPDPEIVMEKYGADAMRYYLLSSPVVSAENLNFAEAGVKEALQKNIMLLQNILNFYQLYDEGKTELMMNSKNVLDQWLIAKLCALISEVTNAMEKYDLPRASRPIQNFIDEFSTWWLRRSRDRFKSENEQDKQQALATFRTVLLELSKVMAPFMPFIADYIYLAVGGDKTSVHLATWPEAKELTSEEKKTVEQMDQVRKIVELGLAERAKNGMKIRQPLGKLIAFGYDLDASLAQLIADEVNVLKVEFAKSAEIKVELDLVITEELKIAAALREMVRAINDMRKKQGLTLGDKVKVQWHSQGDIIQKLLADNKLKNELMKSTLTEKMENADEGEIVEVNGEEVKLKVEKI